MLPWASVATPTHPDDHANARIEIKFTKRRKIWFSESEIYMFTESSPCHGHQLPHPPDDHANTKIKIIQILTQSFPPDLKSGDDQRLRRRVEEMKAWDLAG